MTHVLPPDRQFGTDYMATLMAQSGYDAIAISEADFYEGPAPLSDYMTRLIAASGGVLSAPTFLASKCAHWIVFPRQFSIKSFRVVFN